MQVSQQFEVNIVILCLQLYLKQNSSAGVFLQIFRFFQFVTLENVALAKVLLCSFQKIFQPETL